MNIDINSLNDPNRKKRILFCSEASFLNTGYATYSREILNYLNSTGKYELAELASYGEMNDPRANGLPWKFYGVVPNNSCTAEQHKAYTSKGTNQFGEWIFEQTCLDFLPDFCFDARDFWMCSFIDESPYRPYYNFALMPTVDASPQARQWIAMYERTDACFTYSDWAGKILQDQSGGKINYLGSSPPSANSIYNPVPDKDAHKLSFGIDPKYKIIGTVMRNQRRKLYPDLFAAFKKFITQSEDKNYYLYCHTSYPDLGWDLPELIHQHELAAHVMFTYKCPDTGKIFPSLFRGAVAQSPYTGKWGSTLCNVKNGASLEQLSSVYNLFDLYVQYANCLPPGQGILTSNGWKNIENIKVGDSVLTHTKKWQPVIKLFEHDVNQDVYTVGIHSDCETVTTTAEHPFYALSSAEHKDKKSFRECLGDKLRAGKKLPELKFVEAKELRVGDMVAFPIDTEEIAHTIDLTDYINEDNYTIKDGTYKSKTHNITHPVKIEIDEKCARWIGLYAADGSSSVDTGQGTIKITCHIVNKIPNQELSREVMSRFGNISDYKYPDREAMDVCHSNKVLATYMKKHCKNKENKQLPDWAMKLPLNLQKEVLRGLFMGDCHYPEYPDAKNTSIFNTTSKTLYQQVKQLCRRIGLNYNVRLVIKKGNRLPQYRFEMRGDIKKGIFETKRSNSRGFIYCGYYYSQVKSIKVKPYFGKVYNFEVEKDNSYVSLVCCLHNSEGYGIPLIEAAACGIPLAATDYSAMESEVRKLEGIMLTPLGFYKELETGCMRAVPDNNFTAKAFADFFSLSKDERLKWGKRTREIFEDKCQWHMSGKKWGDYVDSVPIRPIEQTWASPPRIRQPEEKPKDVPSNLNHQDLARWLISKVYCEPEQLNSFLEARLTRDLIFKMSTQSIGGNYINEMSNLDGQANFSEFNFGNAYDVMRSLCERRNYFEGVRVNTMKQKGLMK